MRENYVYYEADQKRDVPLAGFSQEAYNVSTACIAVLNGNVFAQDEIKRQVSLYRSFGGSIILVCRDDILQFWHFSNGQAVCKEQKKINELDNFFAKYKDEFSPGRISRAKTLGQFDKKSHQLSFHDFGLMPIIEKYEGEYLSKLIERIINKLSKIAKIDQESDQGAKWLTQAAFWLVGAKILKDKKVKDFKTLNIADIDLLSKRINRHYDAKTPLDITNQEKKIALEYVASEILKPVSSFSHLSINSLAYVYENTLITKATRKALGTHATPSWLVNYIVWQLVDWIEKIPQKDRVILEPTCGHAPFLTAGARILSFLYKGIENERHEYLKNHLIGIEKDPFAKEIARLALTLADVPNKDGWKLLDADIYNGDILKDAAQGANILLCNPPFENFSPDEKQKCHDLKTGNKAAEVLARTLPYMPIDSVFGVILPRMFLHGRNLAPLRKDIIENFEIREICLLPENVFGSASHLSCVVLGRKVSENDKVTNKNKIRYVRIPKDNLDEFKNTYNAETEIINQQADRRAPDYDFRLSILLSDVWEYCGGLLRLSDIAVVGRGLEYKNVENSTSRKKFKEEAVQGFVRFSKTVETRPDKWKKIDIKLTELPDLYWMDISDDAIENPRYGKSPACAQVLLNYARTSGNNPWRLKALIDREGMPATNSFLVIRPENTEWSLEAIWALINSPYANAFAFCYCMERHNLESIIRNIPLPKCNSSDLQTLKRMVLDYFALYQEGFFQLEPGDKEGEKRMSAINAEVMRLYDLPPKLEREVLDLFNGYKRKGVHFKFDRYYPEGFESWIPLHEYLSEEYQRSTPSFVKKWVEETRSPELIKALEIAMEAFKE